MNKEKERFLNQKENLFAFNMFMLPVMVFSILLHQTLWSNNIVPENIVNLVVIAPTLVFTVSFLTYFIYFDYKEKKFENNKTSD